MIAHASTPSTRVITVGVHTLVSHERGNGTPVLLLHSGGFSSRQFRKLGDLLASHHHLLAPDLLGYGASSRWPEGSPFTFHDDVAALCALLEGLSPAHVVGHSYGGLLALKLALARPSLVRSLALFEPVAFGVLDSAADESIRESLDQVNFEYSGEPWLRTFVEWWNGKGAWDALAPEARASFHEVGWKLSQEVLSLIADRTDGATYGTIAVPTLLMGGARTPMPEQRVLERLSNVMPRAKLCWFADAGHMGPITHAALVNAAIVEHITNTVAGQPSQ